MEDMEAYIERFVEPTIRDFEANPTSVRHAFLACVVTFHAIDYLAHPRASSGARQKARNRSPDFKLVDLIADAFKHAYTGRRDAPDLSQRDVISRPAARYGEAVWDLSRWGDDAGGVTLD